MWLKKVDMPKKVNYVLMCVFSHQVSQININALKMEHTMIIKIWTFNKNLLHHPNNLTTLRGDQAHQAAGSSGYSDCDLSEDE
jgi:hypothetical protein